MALIIVFHNDGTGTETSANYNVGVFINKRQIAKDRIEGHNRADGWERLVRRLDANNRSNAKMKTVNSYEDA